MIKGGLIICLMFFCGVLYSQDYLVMKNGDSSRVHIMEVGATEIKYRYYNDNSGITYGVYRSEVLRIRYKDGTVESFESPKLAFDSDAKCECGRSDASKYHGKKGTHFVLGMLLGPYAMIGTGIARQTPKKGVNMHKSENKDLFKDKDYLRCYKTQAKNNLLTMEAYGCITIIVVPFILLIALQ